MTRFSSWTENEKAFVVKHLGKIPPARAYICKKHHLEAKRHKSSTEHIPKWGENTQPTPHQNYMCTYPECTVTTNLIHTTLDNSEATIVVMPSTDSPNMLCRQHYMKLYRHHPSAVCASCGATPKQGSSFTRHCPEPSVVSQHLTETTGSNITIDTSDCICYTCYKSHLSIVKALATAEQQPSDDTLKRDMDMWSVKLTEVTTDAVARAVLKSVLLVSEHLLQQKAVLLPNVCQVFLEEYGVSLGCGTSTTGIDVDLEVGDSTVKFSSRWLLHQLITYLHPYLQYKCIHRKFGTILFRKGGDLLASLSWALGAMSYNSCQSSSCLFTSETTGSSTSSAGHREKVIEEAGCILNDLLHEEMQQQSCQNTDPSTLNIDQYMEGVHPLILQFLNSATCTVRQRQCGLYPETQTTRQIKKVRHYFILCLLLYCTNPQQPTSFHNLLADVVEVCGGSRQLIRILNRLGCTSSPDTHDRFVTYHADLKRQRKVWDYIPGNVFTIATVDNFDMLQSHAAVYSGDQHRSYHGTTVQLIQPKPTLVVTPTDVSGQQTEFTQSHPIGHSSPLSQLGPSSQTQLRAPSLTLSDAYPQAQLGVTSPPQLGAPSLTQLGGPSLTLSDAHPQAQLGSSPSSLTQLGGPSLTLLDAHPQAQLGVTSPPQLGAPSLTLLYDHPQAQLGVISPSSLTLSDAHPQAQLGLSPSSLTQLGGPSLTLSDAHPQAQLGLSPSSLTQLGGPSLTLLDAHPQAQLGSSPSSLTQLGAPSLTQLGAPSLTLSDAHPQAQLGSSPSSLTQLGALSLTLSDAHQLAHPSQNSKSVVKRSHGHSPASSPHKLGKEGPKRSRTVTVRKFSASLKPDKSAPSLPIKLNLQDFQETNTESRSREELHRQFLSYAFQKYVIHNEEQLKDKVLMNFRQFLDDDADKQQSNVYYMELVDENPDSEETMAQIAEDLIDKFGNGSQQGWVMLVGDGKTYKHLMTIKNQYGTALQKLLILPGDWHILKNYQPVLMKVYYHAGLRELAKSSGYHGTTLKSLETCSNFKRTHNFLLQVWEAIYREMLKAYHSQGTTCGRNIIADAQCILSSGITESQSPKELMKRIEELITDDEMETKFKEFIKQQSLQDDIWKFWSQFVFSDCFSYVGLYLAIRGGNWNLRVSSLKQMAPMFCQPFDRDYYGQNNPITTLADISPIPTLTF